MSADGSMARLPALVKFARKHALKIVTISDIIRYRRKREKLIEKVLSVHLATKFGAFTLHLYQDAIEKNFHIALTSPAAESGRDDKDPLVRVHSQCLTGDIFHSLHCDCGEQLHRAMTMISREGGALIYLPQEGRGIGLVDKLKAYRLQFEENFDTVEANKKLGYAADLRDYGIGSQILLDLGLRRIRLLTNNPRKIIGLAGYGIEITRRLPIEVAANPYSARYLATKKRKLDHILNA